MATIQERWSWFTRKTEGGVDVTQDQGATHRRGRLQSVDQPAERRRKRRKRTKLQRQSTLVRHKVESLPTFWPIFIVLVSLAQVAGMVVLLAVFGSEEGLAPVLIAPEEKHGNYASLSTDSGMMNVTYYRAVNLWVGLTPPQMIQIGAKFTPCMRTDFEIRRRNTRINDRDDGGCCFNNGNFGNTPAVECAGSTNPTSDSFFVRNETCNDPRGLFHPCCISITGKCAVITEEECDDRNGWFHRDLGNCSQVNCFEEICGFSGSHVGEEGGNPTLPTANQFWRWFLSIFIHLGVIHIVLIMPVQLYVGIKIERTIGWLRVGLIYIISGVGGNIVSGIFIPYDVNAGASGAVFGLLGVLFVELFQFWQIVDNAWLELLKLSGFVVFLLVLGTLPYVDNMAHIGGLAFGVVSAVIFVPYITFGKWDAFRKRVLLVICCPLLLAMLIAGFITFYLIPNPDFCPECQYINCIPYADNLCGDEYTDADPDIFSL